MRVSFTTEDIKVTVGSIHITCPCGKENIYEDVTEKDVLICCNCQAKYRMICAELRVKVIPHIRKRKEK